MPHFFSAASSLFGHETRSLNRLTLEILSTEETGKSINRSGAQVHQIRPLEDPRWVGFVERHPRSSAFHTSAWLEALRRTFDYEPIALTTSHPNAKLEDAIVLCRVNSWITGRRLVSLPFSDHCDPLVGGRTDIDSVLLALQHEVSQKGLHYAEIRPTREVGAITDRSDSIHTYCSHQIDLRQSVDTLFRRCHKSSTQRKIRRSEREGLTCEEGRSEDLLDHFYRLMLLTRRRHNAPPQPKRWFQNLIDCFGSALKIQVAFKDSQPISAILTLRHKDALVYKYGCSDARFHRMGGVQFLFWRSILEAKQDGLRAFDLGRSEWGHTGLITFKDHWGAERSELRYSRLSASRSPSVAVMPAGGDWKEQIAKVLFPHLSDRILCSAGDLLCRHFA
jgi:CelD/BcsL family acetyltransferase involved in cellulose biosynthesis